MALGEADVLAVLLRALVYTGTVLSAGAVLFRFTFATLACVGPALRKQIAFGALLLIVCEPLRYILFQLQIAGGDFALALSPSMRWIGLETPLGQAALMRLAALAVVLAVGLRFRFIGLAGAAVMIGAYLVEGHTASGEARAILAPILFLHLLAVHWWIGALPPLRVAASVTPPDTLAPALQRFGAIALWGVGLLAVAGVVLLGALIDWRLDPAAAYHQAFALKLALVGLILTIAALNRLRITPQLARHDPAGRRMLKTSLNVELIVAFSILCASALATAFPPASEGYRGQLSMPASVAAAHLRGR